MLNFTQTMATWSTLTMQWIICVRLWCTVCHYAAYQL